jgi:transcription-repair coupling factor (superfamily II helicase)
VVSQLDYDGIQLIVLPDRDSAEYCAADLYNLVEGDCVFFLPDSGKRLEKSNYKSTLGVQRTSAIGKILDHNEGRLVVVTYPSAIEEGIPEEGRIRESLLKLTVGDEISHDEMVEKLFGSGFQRVDFVAEPGQFAVRGAIVDIFSYSYSDPFRISFFGDEIETINIFDCNTQLSKEKVHSAEIYPDLIASEQEEGTETSILDILPEETLVWLDSSDMYRNMEFFPILEKFRRIYMEVPLSRQVENAVKFNITPQPSFNKNFELLTEDIRKRLEEGYRVRIYGEKQSQLERLSSILSQNGGMLPEFVQGRNVHNGFVDHENKVCCYSDHEIFDRFHRDRKSTR